LLWLCVPLRKGRSLNLKSECEVCPEIQFWVLCPFKFPLLKEIYCLTICFKDCVEHSGSLVINTPDFLLPCDSDCSWPLPGLARVRNNDSRLKWHEYYVLFLNKILKWLFARDKFMSVKF
jgi:hypothetical protein